MTQGCYTSKPIKIEVFSKVRGLIELFLICFRLVYFMCVGALLARMCTTCVPGSYEGQKRALDYFEWGLWMIVSYHVGAGG